MPDTILSPWQKLFTKRGDDPFFAEIQGALYCWFCGMPSLNEGGQLHELDCIWIRARALIAEAHGRWRRDSSPRAESTLHDGHHEESAAPVIPLPHFLP